MTGLPPAPPRSALLPVLVAALLVGSTGCWVPIEQGRAMESDLVRLKDDLSHQQKELQKLESRARKEQEELLARVDGKMAEIGETLEALNRASRKTGADLSVELESTQQDVAMLRGLVEEAQVRFAALEDALALLKEETDAKGAARPREEESPRPVEKQAFYDLAKAKLDAGEHQQARELFTEFLGKWRSDALAANAQYWLAETFYAQKRYREAIFEFQKVQEAWPKSDKVPDSLLKIGFSFVALGVKDGAVPFLEEVVSAHPKAPAARLAREKLKELKR